MNIERIIEAIKILETELNTDPKEILDCFSGVLLSEEEVSNIFHKISS